MAFNRMRRLFRSVVSRLGWGNLMTVVIALLIVFTGRFFILSVAARIPQQKSGLIVHQAMSSQADAELDQSFEISSVDHSPLKPFEQINGDNSISISSNDITATDEFWNHDWWVRYLLQKMAKDSQNFRLTDNRSFMLYRDDGVKPEGGIKTGNLNQEWLLSESQVIGQLYDRNWSLKTAWEPVRGLTYFRLDAPQYLHGELKADDAILEQAEIAANDFRRKLILWIRDVTSEDAKAPVAVPTKWYSQPTSHKMEGMICHVIYEGDAEDSRFVVFYNVAIMQVTGFTCQQN